MLRLSRMTPKKIGFLALFGTLVNVFFVILIVNRHQKMEEVLYSSVFFFAL